MIEPRPQRAELLHGRFVRPGGVDQQGVRGGTEWDLFDQFQQTCQVGTIQVGSRRVWNRER